MSEQATHIFGIDLGTTYSCIALVDEHGKPAIISNFEGDRVTPSVVFFDEDDHIVVGEEAKNSISVYPDKVVSFIKRSMGNEHFLFEHNGQSIRPEEISAHILKKLAKDASDKTGQSVTDVVITCPAYFGINQREATRAAGKIAGLNVRAIINEPTAAAITYGSDKEENKVVLVYDLGGGTFDVTMIEITAAEIKVIVTGGSHELGGKDWDNAIMNYLVDCFKEDTGTEEDITMNQETLGDLQLAAEKAKKTLSQRPKTNIKIVHEGETVKTELTKEKFEELTNPLLEQTIQMTKDMLAAAEKKGYQSFDEIILVGGSSKMPQVKKRVDEEFTTDSKIFDPDESVAKGAAIYGWKMMVGDGLIKKIAEETGIDVEDVVLEELEEETLEQYQQGVAEDLGLSIGEVKKAQRKVRNVTSKSFGIIALNPNRDKLLYNLILRNESVPQEITKTFGTDEANQATLLIEILESELSEQILQPSEGLEIGTAEMILPPSLPEGSPIEITFKINEEGRLDVKAIEVTDNRIVETSIQTTSVIAGEDLEEAIERSKGLVIM